ncbi:MAG: translation initiation factor IF-2 [Oscillospiraceae bacterium]|jgi:translation initiation factor IF-2|nr:translation initiation factor IF-2 [Oscillospiraceae bacterium]
MGALTKYRVHEIAKDFGWQSKVISDLMTEILTAPKNHMQALQEDELNVLFDCITQRNQIDSMEIVFSDIYHEPEPPAEVKPPPGQTAPAGQAAAQSIGNAAAKPAVKAPAAAPMRKVPPQVHVVDTRGVQLNHSRYDERVDRLVPDRADRMKQGKEKIKTSIQKKQSQQYMSNKRKAEEQERMRRLRIEALKKQVLRVMIPDEISVQELAVRLKKTGAEVVKQLMRLGVMASLSQSVDFDTASLVAMEFGARIEREIVTTIEERLIDDSADADMNLEPRDPVVVVMGHVDHGKTSLLDYIRSSKVAAGEAGGITQHIGAYRVEVGGRHVTFLDTPGHAAFTSMRARGAMVTDIAILVVAADDGIMPQTVEAISHAKAADTPIVVAINKIDKPEANPERITQQLTEHSLVPEEWGGDTIVCPVSAKTGEGIDNLLEMLLLTAEMRNLRANPNRPAKGTIIEAKLEKGRGPVATVLVQNGTLRQGNIVIAGKTVGRVRAMADDKGRKLEEAGPSVPVEIVGLADVPDAGDIFNAVTDERMARELVEQRKQMVKDEAGRASSASKATLEGLYEQISDGKMKDLNIIIKADAQGSAEALKASLEKLSNEEARVRVIQSGVGGISESDVLLASASGAVIVGFNVRPDAQSRASAEQAGVDVRLYRVIYDCIGEIEAAMKGMLAPKYKETVLGRAEVRQVFRASGIGVIAGCHVLDGKVLKNAGVRLLRDGVVIYEGNLASLKRFKDDAREVAAGYDCGMAFERFNDVKEGDVVEPYVMEEEKS